MTVSSQTSRIDYAGDGVTAIFPVPFYFLENTHLKVILSDDATGAETVLVLNTDYTVTGAGVLAGGSITVPNEPAVGFTLTILRSVPVTQETDYVPNDPFPAESHERALDKLTMIIQQLSTDIRGAIRVAESDPEPSRLPNAVSRALLLLGFDSAGNPIAVAPVSGSASDLAVNLANDTDPAKGAGQVGFGSTLSYALNTVGYEIASLRRQVITPEQFGAIADGTSHPLSERYATLADAQAVYPHATALTDEIDWAAIQLAVNNNNAIYFGEADKSYYLNKIVEINSGNWLYGNGAILFQENVGFEIFHGLDVSMVVIKGLEFVGSSPDPIIADGTNRAIEIFGPVDCTIENNVFRNWGSSGIFLSGKGAASGPVRCSVLYNTLDNCNDAIFFYVGGSENIIHGNHITRCGRGGIFLDDVSTSDAGQAASPVQRTVVSNNTINGYGGWMAGYGITTGWVENCIIHNNVIRSGTGDAISIFAGGTSADIPLSSLYNSITQNQIRNVSGWGIVLLGSRDNTIQGNVLVDCWLNAAAGARAYMQCSSLTRNATTVASSGNLFIGNHLLKVAAGSDMDYGLRFDADNNNNGAFNNRIIGATTSAILDQGTGNTAANNLAA